MATAGRPSSYTVEIADEICERIAIGESVRQICLLEHMPDEATFYRWLLKYDDLREKYARAKEAQADRFNEELTEIADDGRNDWVERENQRTGSTFIALNEEAIARAKLRIETRKWLMGKHKPKKYGDKITSEITGPNGGPVAVSNVTAQVLREIPTERLESILAASDDAGKN